MSKTVEIFFDLASPYSYLAATQVQAIADKHGAKVAWKPFVLGAVFKATSNTMPAAVPAKAKYMLDDLARWAAQYGVGFKMATHWPVNAVKAMRLCIVGDQEGKAAATTLAGFKALWVDDRDLTAEATLREIAQNAGLDPDRALAAIESPDVKDRLRAYTDDAIKRGAFGAPALFVGDQLFWGNDRLHHVEKALAE